MMEVMLNESTQELLNDPALGVSDTDTKIRQLVEAEYRRQLGRYHRVDHALTRKYEMTFAEFLGQRVVAQRGYSWEVEKDAMDWETAVSGIHTVERKLKELRTLLHETDQ